MITKFSPATIKKLGYYVYVYSDPDTWKAFYVGKKAPKRVREKYIGKSVTSYFTFGNSNPIKYEGKEFAKIK